jgi:hypothetical protein
MTEKLLSNDVTPTAGTDALGEDEPVVEVPHAAVMIAIAAMDAMTVNDLRVPNLISPPGVLR